MAVKKNISWFQLSTVLPIIAVIGVTAVSCFFQATPARLVLPSSSKLIILDGEHLNLGLGRPGDLLQKRVTLQNVGNSVLFITKLQAGCGCAFASLSQKEIPPGGLAYLDLRARVQKKSRHFQVLIETNESKGSQIVLNAFTEVLRPPLHFSPEELDFGEVPGKSLVKRTFEVNAAFAGLGNLNLDPFQVSTGHNKVLVEVLPVDSEGRRRSVMVWPRPGLPEGEFFDEVIVKVGEPEHVIQVPVRGTITGSLQIAPKVLYFASIGFRKKVIVRRLDTKPLGHLVKFEGPNHFFVTEEPGSREGQSRFLLIDFTPPERLPMFSSKIWLWFSGVKKPIWVGVVHSSST